MSTKLRWTPSSGARWPCARWDGWTLTLGGSQREYDGQRRPAPPAALLPAVWPGGAAADDSRLRWSRPGGLRNRLPGGRPSRVGAAAAGVACRCRLGAAARRAPWLGPMKSAGACTVQDKPLAASTVLLSARVRSRMLGGFARSAGSKQWLLRIERLLVPTPPKPCRHLQTAWTWVPDRFAGTYGKSSVPDRAPTASIPAGHSWLSVLPLQFGRGRDLTLCFRI